MTATRSILTCSALPIPIGIRSTTASSPGGPRARPPPPGTTSARLAEWPPPCSITSSTRAHGVLGERAQALRPLNVSLSFKYQSKLRRRARPAQASPSLLLASDTCAWAPDTRIRTRTRVSECAFIQNTNDRVSMFRKLPIKSLGWVGYSSIPMSAFFFYSYTCPLQCLVLALYVFALYVRGAHCGDFLHFSNPPLAWRATRPLMYLELQASNATRGRGTGPCAQELVSTRVHTAGCVRCDDPSPPTPTGHRPPAPLCSA